MVQSSLGTNDFIPCISRSKDGGLRWSTRSPIWPDLIQKYSIFCNLSRSAEGELFLFGSRTAIDRPGELFWKEENWGMKQNELIWANSSDAGRTWTDPSVVPMPFPCSAEVAGTLCVTRNGRWAGPFAPSNTFDTHLQVERNQIVVVTSDDRGKRWRHTSMLRFDDPDSSGAETWVVELAGGRLLGTCWHTSQKEGKDFPNAYALSYDGGDTWTPTRSTGINGQSAALTALPDGKALFIYNQRKHGVKGVWLALVDPKDTDFGILANEPIWEAEKATRGGSAEGLDDWTDFSFGEPSATLLPDGSLLATLWCQLPSGSGIRYIHLRLNASQ